MKLIDNWKGALGHYSTKAMAFGLTLQGAWIAIPDAIKQDLEPHVHKVVANLIGCLFALGLVGKFIDQTPKDQP